VTRRWLNWEGDSVCQHLAQTLQALDAVYTGQQQEQQHQSKDGDPEAEVCDKELLLENAAGSGRG